MSSYKKQAESYRKEDAENAGPNTQTVKAQIIFEVYFELNKDYTTEILEEEAELWAKKKGLPKPDLVEDISWVS